jgi:hypothetical protein
VRTPTALSRFITARSAGQALATRQVQETLAVTSGSAPLNGAPPVLFDDVDSAMAVTRRLACTNCGVLDEHDAVACTKQCLMQNCRLQGGRHKPDCIRHASWLRSKDKSAVSRESSSRPPPSSAGKKPFRRRDDRANLVQLIDSIDTHRRDMMAQQVHAYGRNDQTQVDRVAGCLEALDIDRTTMVQRLAQADDQDSDRAIFPLPTVQLPHAHIEACSSVSHGACVSPCSQVCYSLAQPGSPRVPSKLARPMSLPQAPQGYVWRSTAVDSGATVTTCSTSDTMYDCVAARTPLHMANFSKLVSERTGKSYALCTDDHNKMVRFGLGRSVHVPSMLDLHSVSTMLHHGDVKSVHLGSSDSHMVVAHEGELRTVPLRWDGRLFYLDQLVPVQRSPSVLSAPCTPTSVEPGTQPSTLAVQWSEYIGHYSELYRDEKVRAQHSWRKVVEPPGMWRASLEHRQYNHASTDRINRTRALAGLPPIRAPPRTCQCAICALSKARKLNVPRTSGEAPAVPPHGDCKCNLCAAFNSHLLRLPRKMRRGDSVSMDLSGRFAFPTLGGHYYMVVIIDRHTRYMYVQFVTHKSDALAAFKQYIQYVGYTPRHVHMDNAGEHMGVFAKFCLDKGITQTFICPYGHEQNAIVERRMQLLKNAGRAALLESGLPPAFYGRALVHAAHIENQLVHPLLPDTTPQREQFPDSKPHQPVVFGSAAYLTVWPQQKRGGVLKYPGQLGIYVGESKYGTGALIYEPLTGSILPRRDVRYDQHWRYSASGSIPSNACSQCISTWTSVDPPTVHSDAGASATPADADQDEPTATPDPQPTPPNEGGSASQDKSAAEPADRPTPLDQGGSQHASSDAPPPAPDAHDRGGFGKGFGKGSSTSKRGKGSSSTSMPQSDVPTPASSDLDASHPSGPQLDPFAEVPDTETSSVPKFVELCSGTAQFLQYQLEADPTAEGWAFDIMPEEQARALMNLPSHLQSRLHYVEIPALLLQEIDFAGLQRLCIQHTGVRLQKLSGLHVSPPCTTFTKAHHADDERNPHRVHGVATSDLAKEHDRLLRNLCEILHEVAQRTFSTVLSIENPDCSFQFQRPVLRLLGRAGWQKRTADHCVMSNDRDPICPRKRSTWIMFNVKPTAPFRTCGNACRFRIGTSGFHKILVCSRDDQHPEQVVQRDKWLNGRLPHGCFHAMYTHRQRTPHEARRPNPNKKIAMPDLPLNEKLIDTGKAVHPDVKLRCSLVHGKSFLQAHAANVRYKRRDGQGGARGCRYRKSDLQYDLDHGYLRVHTFKDVVGMIGMSAASRPCMLHPSDNLASHQDALIQFLEESLLQVHSGSDPLTEREAMHGPEWEQYFAAMGIEVDALEDLDCWEIRDASEQPAHSKLYKGKFVLKKKPPANNAPAKHKARYCISDPKFLQRLAEVDCFSPMSRLETIRYLLSALVERNWDLVHTDICNAFPTATLDTPVWMQVPNYLIQRAARLADCEPDPAKAQQIRDQYQGKVCYVTKALYGLGNAPRQFNKHLDKWFKANGYRPATADSCLYLKYDDSGVPICAVATFVDDALVAGTPDGIADYRARIQADFGIRDYGLPTDFVGMEVSYDKTARTCKISHEKYISKMAERYNVQPSTRRKPAPMMYNTRLEPGTTQDARCDPTAYRSIVGALHFSAHSCRPDIANAVRELSKFMVDPTVIHLDEARRVLQYLVDTKHIGITYTAAKVLGPDGKVMPSGVNVAFTDASYAECIVSRKSTSGYVILRNGGAISWSSHTQKQVSLSSADAEYKACSDAARECMFMRKLDRDFRDTPLAQRDREASAWYDFSTSPNLTVQPSDSAPATVIFEDNEATIKWVQNPCHHARTKHIDVCYHFIRDEASPERSNIHVQYIKTTSQLADALTKQLNPAQHWHLISFIMNIQPLTKNSAAKAA